MIAADAWRSSPFPSPPGDAIERSLCDALLDMVDRQPEDVAVIDGDRTYPFAAFAARVGGLAAQLRESDMPPGPIAAIQSTGVDMVASWFASAAAGRVLVILDPNNPAERNRELAALAGARMFLHDEAATNIPGGADMRSIVPDGRTAPLMHGAGLAPPVPMMIFPTSGSTGTPKLIAHSATTMQARVQASIMVMGAGRGDVVLIAGAHGNFGFVHHALTFLLAGGTLCLFDLPGAGIDGLATRIGEQRVEHLRFTPSLFRLAARLPVVTTALRSLRGLRFSGEPLLWSDVELARAITDPGCSIQNVYGSTESAIFLWTDDRTAAPDTGRAPIGNIYPLWDHVLLDDDDAVLSAETCTGHLVVRSRYQALGDWRDGVPYPARFPLDRQSDGHRIYKTGDIVRREVNGRLTMLDRRDRMVKVNGQRIALGEVEAHLRAIPGCRAAVALMADDRLAAFLVEDVEGGIPVAPRRWLMDRLPRQMVPGHIRIVADLPLLPGGKVDHARLALSLAGEDADPEPPATTDERRAVLHDLWTTALDRPNAAAGIDRDFFDLGGDSLRLLNLRLMVEKTFGRSIDIDAFVDRPTLRALAVQLRLPDDAPDTRTRPVDGAPRFRRVRAALRPSRGIALVMPGRGGEAMVEPWLAVEALPDHDIWACDVGWPDGHILQRERWITTAERIAAALQSEDAPRPVTLVGFSIGGYIAWLVDRLLASSPYRPDRLICLDPAPMHRRPRYCSARLRRLIARTLPQVSANMLLIRRATGDRIQSPDVARPGWTTVDGRIAAVEIRAIEHADMICATVLTASAPHIAAFTRLLRPSADDGILAKLSVPTDSGRVYEMLADPRRATSAEIEAMTIRLTRSGSYMSLTAMLYLALAHADRDGLDRVIQRIHAFYPNSTIICLARRLTRSSGIAAPKRRTMPDHISLDTVSSIRQALGVRERPHGNRATPSRLRPPLFWHVTLSFIEARWQNLRRRAKSMMPRPVDRDPAVESQAPARE